MEVEKLRLNILYVLDNTLLVVEMLRLKTPYSRFSSLFLLQLR